MRISYRQAQRKDIGAMMSVQKNDGFPHQYFLTEKRLLSLFKRGEQFFVAMEDDRIVGFGSVDCEIRAQVHFICVDTRYAKRGIGRSLMRRCIQESRKRGCTRICSFVEANSSKEPFLVKMGFHQVGFYTDRYGNGVDATIWEKSVHDG